MSETDVIQGVFDFESGRMNGFDNWRREQEERLEQVRREWNVPVGKRVRLKLVNIDQEFEGRLRLVYQPLTIDRRVPLALRLNQMNITIPEIEWCVIAGE